VAKTINGNFLATWRFAIHQALSSLCAREEKGSFVQRAPPLPPPQPPAISLTARLNKQLCRQKSADNAHNVERKPGGSDGGGGGGG